MLLQWNSNLAHSISPFMTQKGPPLRLIEGHMGDVMLEVARVRRGEVAINWKNLLLYFVRHCKLRAQIE